jgi:hypothetical protein
MYNLFLDDTRMPKDAYIHNNNSLVSLNAKSDISDDDWVIVRNYTEFAQTLELLGMPEAVSFDHDLCYEHIKHYFNTTVSTGVIEYGNLKEKTGMHCAQEFVRKWQELKQNKQLRVFIHSANQYGVVEIGNILSPYFTIEY